MIVLVDVDDTVVELVPDWLKKYNKKFKDNLKMDDILSWDIATYTKLEDKTLFYNLLNKSIYKKILPTPMALEGVNFLRIFSRVVFVTSNFGDVGRAKFNALNRLGFQVDKKDFIEASDKSLIRGDFLIDDNFDNCNSFSNCGILFTKPWNLKDNFEFRVNNWNDIMNFFAQEMSL